MTYLQMVNKVLVRLRETSVATVNATDYSALIGEFVNDAKRQVEESWDWSQLRSLVNVPTVASQATYSITGFNDGSKVFAVYNDTHNSRLNYQTRDWMREKRLLNTVPEGVPMDYTFAGIDGSGDAQVTVYPTPDAVYTLSFDCTLRPEDLSVDGDTALVPHTPIVHLALALAARERGEQGGTTTQEYLAIAQRSLADAIALDAARHPEETIWYNP